MLIYVLTSLCLLQFDYISLVTNLCFNLIILMIFSPINLGINEPIFYILIISLYFNEIML